MKLSSDLPVNAFFAPLVALTAFILCLRKIGDFDYWTHLALGRAYWSSAGGNISEPFVLLRMGVPLENNERVFQMLLYPIRAIGSDAAICLAIAFIAACIFFIYARLLPNTADTGTRAITFAYLIATLVAVQFRFAPRPEVPAYLLFALILALTQSFKLHPSRCKLVVMVLIVAAWVPLHVTWTIGAVLAITMMLTKPRLDFWKAQTTTTGGVLFLCIVAAAVIMAGFHTISFGQFVLGHLAQGGILAGITEMRPTWEFPEVFHEFCLVSLFALMLTWGTKERRGGRLFFWAIALAIGLFVVRNTAIALLGMVPIAMEGLESRKNLVLQKYRTAVVCTSLLTFVVLAWGSLRKSDPPWGVGVQWLLFPREAAAFVKERKLPARVFNNWDCGGYLNWAWGGDPKTFLDGRLGTSSSIVAHDAVIDGINPAATINQLDIKTILIQPLYHNSGRIVPGLFWLLGQPEWQLVHASDAFVFVKGRLPAGVTSLPAHAVWRSLSHHIAMMPPDWADDQEHLLYSFALSHYFSGDTVTAQQLLADARLRTPRLFPEYRNYFLFPTEPTR
ncbi:hypothetical protein [Pelotalea chapellei]|uniref:Uncharacterized protein n=1 Tax=Pelotalea chapellei TaxID=44671 RepID=A0ABS5UA76_9BACT|nr:hypothetical protein [Pelotalea chapellei]MBT1072577.1 hypothetical protein [Pelotalea chapellei]